MTTLPLLYRHHKWANLQLIDALAAMSPEDLQRRQPGGFGTIHETLYHYVINEGRFIEALQEKDTAFGAMPSELPSCQSLRETAAANADLLIQFAGTVTPETRVKGKFSGRDFDMPAIIPLFQSYHHAVEHRTNITTVLATYDLPQPPIDLWSWLAAGMP